MRRIAKKVGRKVAAGTWVKTKRVVKLIVALKRFKYTVSYTRTDSAPILLVRVPTFLSAN